MVVSQTLGLRHDYLLNEYVNNCIGGGGRFLSPLNYSEYIRGLTKIHTNVCSHLWTFFLKNKAFWCVSFSSIGKAHL